MKAPSPPETPNPYAVASAQQMANIETAIANSYLANADEVRPDGTVTYEVVGTAEVNTYQYDDAGALIGTTPREIPRFRKTVSLSTEGQTQFAQQQQIAIAMNQAALAQAQALGERWQEAFSLDELPEHGTAPTLPTLSDTAPTPGAIVASIGDADLVAHLEEIRDAIDARLQYQIEIDRDARIVKLANMGIFPGAEAYTREMLAFDRQSNDARTQAYLAAQQEQNRIITLEEKIGNFANAAQEQAFRQGIVVVEFVNNVRTKVFQIQRELGVFVETLRERALQEFLAERNQVINEISALMSGGQVQVPQFQPFRAGHISDTPVGEYVYRSAAMDMQKWQARVEQQQQMTAGLISLGGSLLMAPMTGGGSLMGAAGGKMFGM
jgi:hypothetical protein